MLIDAYGRAVEKDPAGELVLVRDDATDEIFFCHVKAAAAGEATLEAKPVGSPATTPVRRSELVVDPATGARTWEESIVEAPAMAGGVPTSARMRGAASPVRVDGGQR